MTHSATSRAESTEATDQCDDIAYGGVLKTRSQKLLIILCGVVVGVVVFAITSIARRRSEQNTPAQKRETVTSVPQIVTCVKRLTIVKAELLQSGTPDAALVVELKNEAEVGITAIVLSTTRDRETYEITRSASFSEDGNPKTVIEPHSSGKMTMALPFPQASIQIGGVLYSDGTEEGCKSSLKTLHGMMKDELKRKQAGQ
ncbi:MAG: hypothetical protein JWM21_3963 [Acidobacteria bacterium]|nr:hypothetical protein [Acidobacteriota bacterium]